MTPAERFWSKVDTSGDCWVWLAGRSSGGYGKFRLSRPRRMVSAHRFSYEQVVRPIPEGLTLDHLCRNRACVNPAHLEPVSHRENILRGETLAAAQVARTHCPKGHPYDAENTYRAGGKRYCRECGRAEGRARRAKAAA